ncbi:MAG: magnesium transporter CorA family protein [Deltaproteobacteria bacterium]|jgi:magnesium transporter|nr:magnesium transporter CorA family protein [Deltaproteobacteria bacterium]
MLTSYKFIDTEPGFRVCREDERAEWINLEDPSEDELAAVAGAWDLPGQFLTDPLDPKERPRLDQEGRAELIIVSLPAVRTTEKGRHVFSTVPLGLVLCDDVLITVCSEVGLIGDLVNRHMKKPRAVDCRRVLLKILIESSNDYIRHLELMEGITDRAEGSLSNSQHTQEIMTLLTIDKALIIYTVALKSNRAIMTKLMEGKMLSLNERELDLVDQALIENQQAIYMADIFGQVMGSLGDAFGNIINTNLNKIMKFLAGMTIILMLPTLVVGVYGMNITLPLADHPRAFLYISLFCVLLSSLVWIYFLRKKWI